MTQLTEHFTLEELTRSEVALRKGYDNTPTEGVIENLKRLAEVLEQVRIVLGRPLIITSGYRSKQVNDAVGSHDGSHHRYGLAADFIPSALAGIGGLDGVMKKIIGAGIEYDQLILEFNTWIHIAIAEEGEKPRKQALIITKDGVKNYLV